MTPSSSRRDSQTSGILIDRVADWLTQQTLQDSDLQSIVRGTCERLLAAGVPLARVFLSFSVLHPLYSSLGFLWRRGEDLKIEGFRHAGERSERFLRSPFFHMLKHELDHLRRRLDSGGTIEFPVFDDLRQEGMTDYLAFFARFSPTRNQGMMGSWTTDQAGGFAEEEIAALVRIQNRLAVASKLAVREEVARQALTTYLGRGAGERVLGGQIKRGDGETIRSAIVFSDLRGSTQMAETLGREGYIDALNDYFDATAGAIVDAEGEILSFLGDGFLAIFPSGRNRAETTTAARKALSASLEAVRRMKAVNAERADKGHGALRCGIGLHVGNVMFGNVGLGDRMTFSVFGAAVNEATRIEDLTKKYPAPVIASDEFKDYEGGNWSLLGSENMRGVGREIQVYEPSQELITAYKAVARRERREGMRTDAEQVLLLHAAELRQEAERKQALP